ncbi:MAG: metallophosphoesterase [Xanthobacteraceae bacterium]
MQQRRPRKWLTKALARPPFKDELGRKPWLEPLTQAQAHRVNNFKLIIPGWPRRSRPLRVAFLSDFHTGSHAGDVARLGAIVTEAKRFEPDLVLHGGDFVNMMLFGGGRVPPHATAAILARLGAPLGAFAVLGNHDIDYGEAEVRAALRAHDITLLDDERCALHFEGAEFDLLGIPDARIMRHEAFAALRSLSPQRPTLVLAHDPVWFAHLPQGPHLMLSGHTHGGQICLPLLGPFTNKSKAPLRWSHGLIQEGGRYLYVTSGIGTSGVPIRLGIPPEFVIIDLDGA